MSKKPKKSKWILWLIVLIVVLAIGTVTAVALTRYDKSVWEALSYAGQYNEEELEQKHQTVQQKLEETVAALPATSLDFMTERQKEKLNSGELTPEETVEIFQKAKEAAKEAGVFVPALEEEAPEATGSPAATSGGGKETTKTEGVKKPNSTPVPTQEDIDALIAEFYVLKAEYLSSLDSLIRQGKTEWRSKPKSQRTLTARFAMAEKCLAQGNSLEASCDARMAVLLGKLESALVATGQSTALVSEIQSVYNEEKRIKKASLIERYYPK